MKTVYLAKENGGSVIEVRKHGRDWITVDGRCIYQRGSFEWAAPRDRLLRAVNAEGVAK